MAGSKEALPPCDFVRRQIAVEYARMHWCLRAACKRDAVEGWWIISVEPAAGAHEPRPHLSELAANSAATGLGAALGSQPFLRFCGVRGAGDEVYDLVGRDGLLGVRPGSEDDEVLAFMERSAAASAAFRRLTGQDPGHLVAVLSRPGGPPVAGLRVALENTLKSAAGGQGRGGASVGGRGNAWNSTEAARGGTLRTQPKQEVVAPAKKSIPEKAEADVPDSWEES